MIEYWTLEEKRPTPWEESPFPFGKSCRYPVSVAGFPFNRDKLALMDATPLPQPFDESASIGQVTRPLVTVPPMVPVLQR